MLFDQNMIIDATRGSIARFVNHSCEPNCRMEKWTVGGKPRMALFAGERGIMTGDELTYDYNFDPFSQKNVQQCHCRSSKCRGVIGPKPKEERRLKDLGTLAADKLVGAKRRIADIVDEGTNRWNKRARTAGVGSAMATFKKVTSAGIESKTAAQAHVVQPTSSCPAQAISQAAMSGKPALQVASSSTHGPITRMPSMVKRIVNRASRNAPVTPAASNTSSTTKALVQGNIEQAVGRKESMKARASKIRGNVLRTVTGNKQGRRSPRNAHCERAD